MAWDEFLYDRVKYGTYPRNQWFKSGPLEVYLRVGQYRIDDDGPYLHTCVCLANAIIRNDRLHGQGLFKAWIEKAEALCAELLIPFRIENVINPILLPFFRARGYRHRLDGGMDCFVLDPPALGSETTSEESQQRGEGR